MKKITALAAVVFAFFALAAFADVCSVAPTAKQNTPEEGIPLKFINDSGTGVKGIFISETGRNEWSVNLLSEDLLKNKESTDIYIKREDILGLTDIKIIYQSDKERIWKKLPILEIFEITHKRNGEPSYDQIKLGA